MIAINRERGIDGDLAIKRAAEAGISITSIVYRPGTKQLEIDVDGDQSAATIEAIETLCKEIGEQEAIRAMPTRKDWMKAVRIEEKLSIIARMLGLE